MARPDPETRDGALGNDQTYKLPAMVQQYFMDTMIYSMASRLSALNWER